jgi:hypothetical protein
MRRRKEKADCLGIRDRNIEEFVKKMRPDCNLVKNKGLGFLLPSEPPPPPPISNSQIHSSTFNLVGLSTSMGPRFKSHEVYFLMGFMSFPK